MIDYASLNTKGSLNESDLASMRRVIQETNTSLIELYLPRWRGPRDELNPALKAEAFYATRQAIEVGLADLKSNMVTAYATERYRKKQTFRLSAGAKSTDALSMRRAKFVHWKLLAETCRKKNHSRARSAAVCGCRSIRINKMLEATTVRIAVDKGHGSCTRLAVSAATTHSRLLRRPWVR